MLKNGLYPLGLAHKLFYVCEYAEDRSLKNYWFSAARLKRHSLFYLQYAFFFSKGFPRDMLYISTGLNSLSEFRD